MEALLLASVGALQLYLLKKQDDLEKSFSALSSKLPNLEYRIGQLEDRIKRDESS